MARPATRADVVLSRGRHGAMECSNATPSGTGVDEVHEFPKVEFDVTKTVVATAFHSALRALDHGDESQAMDFVDALELASKEDVLETRAGDDDGSAVARVFERVAVDETGANDSIADEPIGADDENRARVNVPMDSLEVVEPIARSTRTVPETEPSGWDARANAATPTVEPSPSTSGLGEGAVPSPVMSADVVGEMGGLQYANPFVHTPIWPRTQQAPETDPREFRRKFVYFREDSDEGATPVVARARVPASAPRPGGQVSAVQSPYLLMHKNLATPYANMERAAPVSVTLTTASGKKVVARTDSHGNAAVPMSMETPRVESDEDAFSFRAAIETPATSAPAIGSGFFTAGSGAPVEISAAAMHRARSMFATGDDLPTVAVPSPDVGGFSFQTAGGARIAVSDDSRRRARAMFGGADDADRPSTSTGGGFAFQTASGTNIKISDETMCKTRALFADQGEENTMKTPINARSRFPQPSFKTPKSLPIARRSDAKAPGFTPPMKTGAFRTPMTKMGVEAAASAGRTVKRARGGSGAPVHDLFAARARMGMRAPLRAFFNGLRPFQSRPVFVDACVRTLCADTAKALRLPSIERGLVGWREMRELMIKAGADEACLTNEWVANTYKWIVWTQACVARAFPEKYAFGVLSESSVLQRMLYKYEREVNRAQRSHLKRVLEKDENPGAPAIFVVSAIRSMTTATVQGAAPTMSEIEVTDGWYGVRARLDAKLTQHVREGRLRVGSKLFAAGSDLRGVTNPVSPLSEDAESAYLCLHANGTRPAPWDATLGRTTYNLSIPMRSVVPDGGVIPRMIFRIRHVYPMMHQERRDEEKSVMRCQPAEHRAQANWQRDRDVVLHELQDAMNNRVGGWGAGVDSERVVREALEEKNLYERRTTAVLRLNVVGFVPSPEHESYRGPIIDGPTSAILTIWDVDEVLAEAATPGQTFAATALKPRASVFHDRELSLSTTRFTRWIPISPSDTAENNLVASEPDWRCMSVRADEDLGDLARSGLPRKEFDTVVCALHCGPPRSTQRGRLSQWIFCLDSSSITAQKQSSHLLAVEICGYDDDTFVKVEEWMPSASPFGASRHECGPPVILYNLEYLHYDRENDVYVARVLMENIVAVLGTTSSNPPAAAAARELEQWRCASAESRSKVVALKARARHLTGMPIDDFACAAESLEELESWDEVNASQRPASPGDEYVPPRLSLDDGWNDETAARALADVVNTADEAIRLSRSAKKRRSASTQKSASPSRTTPRRSSRSSRGS